MNTENSINITKTENETCEKKLVISKKNYKGDDGYKVFSIRIKDDTVAQLDRISQETNRSRNELINMMLDFAIANCEIKI